MRPARATSVAAIAISVGGSIALGCGKSDGATGAAADAAPKPSASAAPVHPVVNALPQPDDAVRKVVNAGNQAPYTGPFGTVRGVVTIKGDVPPALTALAEKIPDKCKPARVMYGRLFREGMQRSLADALVTVTGYKVFVPVKSEAVRVQAEGCAWQQRTISLTFGQRIDVVSKDGESYLPSLVGGQMRASLYATPGGDPVKLYPHVPGRFTLVDQVHPYISADVFAFMYPTHTVTGLDGKFEIARVPPGDMKVNVLLPATMQTAEKTVKVEADKVTEVSLELEFDKKMVTAQPPKKPKIEIH